MSWTWWAVNGPAWPDAQPWGHTLPIVAPNGYVPVQGSAVSLWLHGADTAQPPLAFHLRGVLAVQAFSDDAGDEQRGANEPAVLAPVTWRCLDWA